MVEGQKEPKISRSREAATAQELPAKIEEYGVRAHELPARIIKVATGDFIKGAVAQELPVKPVQSKSQGNSNIHKSK